VTVEFLKDLTLFSDDQNFDDFVEEADEVSQM